MFPRRCLYRFDDADDNVRNQVPKTDLEFTLCFDSISFNDTSGEWLRTNRPALSNIPFCRQGFGTE